MTTHKPAKSGSLWQGKTAEERQQLRRGQLLEAALDLVETGGMGALGVRAICRQARLTERYFYESYDSLNDLIGDIYDSVQTEGYQAMQEAMMEVDAGMPAAEAAISSFVEFLTDDPRRAKVFLMEVNMAGAIGPQLQRRLERNKSLFVTLLQGVSRQDVDPVDLELSATALMGSQTRILLAWTSGSINVSKERVIQHLIEIFRAVAGVTSR